MTKPLKIIKNKKVETKTEGLLSPIFSKKEMV